MASGPVGASVGYNIPQGVAYGGSYQGGSLGSNPTIAPIDLTVRGSDWLWAVFAVMLATALGVTAWTMSIKPGRRAFHGMAAMLLFTASIAYFSMASNLGATAVAVEFVRRTDVLYSGPENVVYRSIWYARYIDWTVTTPLLLLTLLLSTGMPMSDIVLTIFFDIVMIVTGLIGALVTSQYKWGFFVFGCVAMFVVFWNLVVTGRKAAMAVGADVHSAYVRSALLLSFLWLVYPIIWGLADGGNVISTDSEMIAYGILDILAKPGYTIIHLWSLRNIDYDRFGLAPGHYSTSSHNFAQDEKHGLMNGNGAVPHAVANGNGLHNGNGTTPHATLPVGNPAPAGHTGPASGPAV